MRGFCIPATIASCAVVAGANAGITSLSENFSTQPAANYTTWLVNCFQGTADIRTMDAYDSMVVFNGAYELNWNGSPILSGALANNGMLESTHILFHPGYSWNRFSGDFAGAWSSNASGAVNFTFINSATSQSSSETVSLTGLSGSLRHLDFAVSHTFDHIVVRGDFVVMDNLMVSTPAPATAPLLALAGLNARGRRRR